MRAPREGGGRGGKARLGPLARYVLCMKENKKLINDFEVRFFEKEAENGRQFVQG